MSSSIENFRKIIQFMIAKGCVDSEEFFSFLDTMRTDDASQLSDRNVSLVITNINERLKKYNMRIRDTVDDNKRYYSLISTINNVITREASHHTEKEFDYFKQIWEAAKELPIPSDRVKSIATASKVLNWKELVDQWCEKHWLVHEPDQDTYRLGPRSMAELDVLM